MTVGNWNLERAKENNLVVAIRVVEAVEQAYSICLAFAVG